MIRKIMLVIFVLTAGNSSLAHAAPADVPQTGQVTSYDTNTMPADDGAMQKGVAWPKPRFTSMSSGTGIVVTDNLSGLMWTADAGTPTFAGTTSTCTAGIALYWQWALDYVACLNENNYLNHSDWRLPNVNELESLVHAEYARETTCGGACPTNADWLNTQGFSNVYPGYYWSSTTYAADAGYAWSVDMYRGGVSRNYPKTCYFYAWPVRAGQ
jgi:Protein of unknown function (DUF1566)